MARRAAAASLDQASKHAYAQAIVAEARGIWDYFRELGATLASGPPDPQQLAALCARYELEMNMRSVPKLIERFSIRFPGAPLAHWGVTG
jgi:hypothetical protein